jgi:hypothetical protein
MAECASCTAWKVSTDVTVGRCKAHPPVPVLGMHYGQAGGGIPQVEYIFPMTASGDWCREYSAGTPK